ncbi:MAG: hypothetical protein F6K19_46600, partial [Cyanothece sp. SIO1E1]|nr:hypothetical protein [Cyanothece sp. SIO1E1]
MSQPPSQNSRSQQNVVDTSLQDAQVGQAGNDLIQNQGLINQLIKNLTINISGEQLFG